MTMTHDRECTSRKLTDEEQKDFLAKMKIIKSWPLFGWRYDGQSQTTALYHLYNSIQTVGINVAENVQNEQEAKNKYPQWIFLGQLGDYVCRTDEAIPLSVVDPNVDASTRAARLCRRL